MILSKLKNPKSDIYYQIKEFVLSGDFPWFYKQDTHVILGDVGDYQSPPFYSHQLLGRPGSKDLPGKMYPEKTSNYFDNFYPFLEQVVSENDLQVSTFLRFNVNCVHPQDDKRLTVPHVDHQFPHMNLLVYLTDAGGETVLMEGDESVAFHPAEDDIILFQGLHCMRPPEEKRRIVLVATFV